MEAFHSDQYWFWMKRRQILTSNLQIHQAPINESNNNGNSWEERAFAEDAARNILNGSIWPPRSYSCNFCKREFRSAQALGGHMNIHRRDRARLKQNLSPQNNNDFNHQKNINDLGNHYFSPKVSSQIDCYHHFKPCSIPATTIITTKRRSLSPSRMISTIVNGREDNDFNDCVETSLSLGLTSMFGQNSTTVAYEEKDMIRCKRLKTDISSLPSVFLKTCSNDNHHRFLAFQPSEIVLGVNHGIMEDLDLELRLGKQHKVK